MKKSIMLFLAVLLMASCSSPEILSISEKNQNGESVVVDQIEVEPYGVFNQKEKVPGVKYKIHPMTVVVSVVFSETLIVPFLGLGWYLWQPKNIKDPELVKQYKSRQR